MPPDVLKKSLKDFEEWEVFGGFPIHGKTPSEAKRKSEAFFKRYVKKNKLENHVFIQWANGDMRAIPCFGDKRGNWKAGFEGLFRTEEHVKHFDEQHTGHDYKYYIELKNHI